MVAGGVGVILRSLELRRFKKFAGWTAGFSAGLNVIHGPNEAGKTTILEALFAALLMNPAQPPPGFADLVRSWGEKRLGEALLEFQVEGHGYLLRKDFEAGTMLLQSLDRKERQENPREIQRRILDWLGLPSEDAFRSTAYVGQGELARVTDERRLIGAQLSRILSGGAAEDVDAALQWIGQRWKTVEDGSLRPGRGDRQLKALLTQRHELDRRAAQAHALRAELGAVVPRLADLERQVRASSAYMTAAEQQVTLRRREEDVEAELRRVRALLTQLDVLTEQRATNEAAQHALADEYRVALHDFVRARRAVEDLRQGMLADRGELERQEAALELQGEIHQRARRHAGMGLAVVALGAATTTGGLLLAGLQGFPPGLGVAIVGALPVLLGVRLRRQATQTEVNYRAQEQRTLERRERVEQARAHLQEAERTFQATLDALGAPSIEAVEQRFGRYALLLDQQDEIQAAIDQLVGDRSREEIVARMQETECELEDLRRGLHDSPPVETATESPEPPQDVRRLQHDVTGLRERKAWLEGMLEGLRDETDRRQLLEEQIAALEHQQARAREDVDLLQLTRRMLEDARKQSLVPARELLERRASEYLGLVTNNDYRKVAVDGRTMMPRIWVDATGGWRGPASLSTGTVNQLYLALRLALLDVICLGRTPPVFLDEPFVHFDEERLEAVMPLIAAVARQRQVFLFTSRLPHALPADQVISLSRRSQGSQASAPNS